MIVFHLGCAVRSALGLLIPTESTHGSIKREEKWHWINASLAGNEKEVGTKVIAV